MTYKSRKYRFLYPENIIDREAIYCFYNSGIGMCYNKSVSHGGVLQEISEVLEDRIMMYVYKNRQKKRSGRIKWN